MIIVEAMAQAGILLYAMLKPSNLKNNPIFYLGKVEAKFLSIVRPGDTLVIEVIADKIIDSGGAVRATAKVGNSKVSEAKLMFGVKKKRKDERRPLR